MTSSCSLLKYSIIDIQTSHSSSPNSGPTFRRSTIGASLSPSASVEVLSSGTIPSFVFGFAFFFGILFFVVTLFVASYLCTRANAAAPLPLQNPIWPTNGVGTGLDGATLMSYPRVTYSELRGSGAAAASAAGCCSVCLADYKDSDELRQQPECGHAFHAKCVDPWLRLHPSCPLCRTSPLPTPLPTPLVEAVV